MSSFLYDGRHAGRAPKRNPSLFVVVMLTLGFGIAINTASKTAQGEQFVSPSQAFSAGNVLSAETLTLPAFADIAAGPRSPTEAESCCSAADMKVYEQARTDTRFEMIGVTYRSDGLPVVAFIYRPSASGDKRPVIIYNGGS